MSPADEGDPSGAAAADGAQEGGEAPVEPPRLDVLLVAVPEYGHLLPIVQIGGELARRGHRAKLVTFAFAKDKVGSVCSQFGCEFIGMRPDVRGPEYGVGDHAALKKENKTMSLYSWYCDQMKEPIRELIETSKPNVIVADYMNFCLFEVYAESKVPMVINFPQSASIVLPLLSHAAPALLSVASPFLLNQPKSEAPVFAKMSSLLGAHARVERGMINSFEGLEDMVVHFIPPNLCLTGPPAPRPFAGAAAAASSASTSMAPLNDWLAWVRESRLRVVYVSMGTMVALDAAQVSGLAKGLEQLPNVAVLWSLAEAQQEMLPGGKAALPQRFFVHKWLPQAEVLQVPEVAVVITHCGWGGFTETIAAGKPLVATPFGADQPENARIAQRRGIGEILAPTKICASAVAEAVGRVLDTPSYAENAKKLQHMLMRSGGAAKCAELIEEAAKGVRPPGLFASVTDREKCGCTVA